jgi:hypothetical protein
MLKILSIIFTICIFIYGLHKLCVWLEKNGYLYYINKKSDMGFLSGSLEAVNSMLNPAVKHTIEMKQNQATVEKQRANDNK